MSADNYLSGIVGKYALLNGATSEVRAACTAVLSVIQRWAGNQLVNVGFSGSLAKGTAIRGVTDADLFISLKHDTKESLADIHASLKKALETAGYTPRLQKVSLGITHSGVAIDLVPGKKQAGNTGDHSLYRRRARTWTQTNVNDHINLVASSGRLDEIRLTKIWRSQHRLTFPSFYLEMCVIDALYRKPTGQLTENFLTVLRYLADDFADIVMPDPANSNNNLSDDLTADEKQAIARSAKASLQKPTWGEVVW